MVCQNLLREKCIEDEKLFTSFLNRLFNTLNWTVTEFSVSVKDMQDHRDQRQVKRELLNAIFLSFFPFFKSYLLFYAIFPSEV